MCAINIGFSVGIHHFPCLYIVKVGSVWGIGMMQAFFCGFLFNITIHNIWNADISRMQ